MERADMMLFLTQRRNLRKNIIPREQASVFSMNLFALGADDYLQKGFSGLCLLQQRPRCCGMTHTAFDGRDTTGAQCYQQYVYILVNSWFGLFSELLVRCH